MIKTVNDKLVKTFHNWVMTIASGLFQVCLINSLNISFSPEKIKRHIWNFSWWRHRMETFLRYWPFVRVHRCAVTGEFPAQRSVTRGFDVFFDLRLNKRLSKPSWGWLFETPPRSLWCHCNVTVGSLNADILRCNLDIFNTTLKLWGKLHENVSWVNTFPSLSPISLHFIR